MHVLVLVKARSVLLRAGGDDEAVRTVGRAGVDVVSLRRLDDMGHGQREYFLFAVRAVVPGVQYSAAEPQRRVLAELRRQRNHVDRRVAVRGDVSRQQLAQEDAASQSISSDISIRFRSGSRT
jgi:hypothetical protein